LNQFYEVFCYSILDLIVYWVVCTEANDVTSAEKFLFSYSTASASLLIVLTSFGSFLSFFDGDDDYENIILLLLLFKSLWSDEYKKGVEDEVDEDDEEIEWYWNGIGVGEKVLFIWVVWAFVSEFYRYIIWCYWDASSVLSLFISVSAIFVLLTDSDNFIESLRSEALSYDRCEIWWLLE
jgi:hypothetical protein